MNKIFKSVVSIAVSLIAAGCLMLGVACGNGEDNKGKTELTYTASALPEAEVTVEYTASVATATGAEGIKYTMSKGALPAGITLSSEGALSGKPTKDGDFNFTVKATAGSESATADFTLKVNKHLYDITYAGDILEGAVVGEAYTANVATATSAGTAAITYSTTDTLPAGLSLSADGKLTGTPTAAVEGEKTIKITASASDAKSVTANFTLTVTTEKLPAITYTASTLASAQKGTSYTASVATATGATNVKYSLYGDSKLPAGLTLAENGAISGTPTCESATYEFTVRASASGHSSATAKFSLLVRPEKGVATKYTFEAEGVDLTGFKGSGISGSAEGTKVITVAHADSKSSNGYYVGWTHAKGIKLTFVINADEAGKAKLSLALASESSPMPVKSSTMTVTVNGKNITYDAKKTAPATNGRYCIFEEYVISESIDLIAGENVIELTIADNKLGNGSAALGFMIDALYLETQSYVSWTPHNTEIYNK